MEQGYGVKDRERVAEMLGRIVWNHFITIAPPRSMPPEQLRIRVRRLFRLERGSSRRTFGWFGVFAPQEWDKSKSHGHILVGDVDPVRLSEAATRTDLAGPRRFSFDLKPFAPGHVSYVVDHTADSGAILDMSPSVSRVLGMLESKEAQRAADPRRT